VAEITVAGAKRRIELLATDAVENAWLELRTYVTAGFPDQITEWGELVYQAEHL
jgi:hypothetical protein